MTRYHNHERNPRCIGLMVFDRIQYFSQVLSSLKLCTNFEKWDVFISIDGISDCHSELKKLNVQKCHQAALEFSEWCKTKHPDIEVCVDRKCANLRTHRHKLSILNSLFDSYEYVLLVEDDVVLCRDALDWFLAMENTSRKDSNNGLQMINGFSHNLLKEHPEETFYKATEFIKRDTSIFHKFWFVNAHYPWGFLVSKQVWEKYIRGQWSGCDQDLTNLIIRHKGVSISPCITRTTHIGREGHNTGRIAFMPEHVVTADDQELLNDDRSTSVFQPIAPCQFMPDGTFNYGIASDLQGGTWVALQSDVYTQTLGGHHICVVVWDEKSSSPATVIQDAYTTLQRRFPFTTFVQQSLMYGSYSEMERFIERAVATLGILFCTTEITKRCAHEMLNYPKRKCPCITVDINVNTDMETVLADILAAV